MSPKEALDRRWIRCLDDLLTNMPKAEANEHRSKYVTEPSNRARETFIWKELPTYFNRDTDPVDMPMEPAEILQWGQQYMSEALDQWIAEKAIRAEAKIDPFTVFGKGAREWDERCIAEEERGAFRASL